MLPLAGCPLPLCVHPSWQRGAIKQVMLTTRLSYYKGVARATPAHSCRHKCHRTLPSAHEALHAHRTLPRPLSF